jgi:hypothetical protein
MATQAPTPATETNANEVARALTEAWAKSMEGASNPVFRYVARDNRPLFAFAALMGVTVERYGIETALRIMAESQPKAS